MIRKCAIVVALASATFVSSMLNAAPAQATVLPAEGGRGGQGFSGDCPAGQYLVGVSTRAGAFVDAIAPLCAPFLPQAGKFGGWKRQGRYGGTGGSPHKDRPCPADRYVSGLRIGFTRDGYERKYVEYVRLTCRSLTGGADRAICLQTGEGCWTSRPGRPGPLGLAPLPFYPAEQSCPANEAATGIHGRSGNYVDALGLICGRKPSTASPTAAKRGKIRPLGKKSSATCKSSYVWRVARADDLVCVTPASRTRVAQENATAASRIQPGGGAYGPHTCKAGFVWREAFKGDVVCVTPKVRSAVREENRLAASRRVQ